MDSTRVDWLTRRFPEGTSAQVITDNIAANRQALQSVRSEFKAVVESASSEIAASNLEGSHLVAEELSYFADSLSGEIRMSTQEIQRTIQHTSAAIIYSIQQYSAYLGDKLDVVRLAVEKLTDVSKQQLELLLNSLDNESRQYYEQGVLCFEQGELDIAEERLEKALEADRTNYFAYLYLGQVSMALNQPHAAQVRFERAAKFAPTTHHRAMALSYAATAAYQSGGLDTAREHSAKACELDETAASYLHQSAAYLLICSPESDHSDLTNEVIDRLSRAIATDPAYYAIVAGDLRLSSVRIPIFHLLEKHRTNAKDQLVETYEDLVGVLEWLSELEGRKVTIPADLKSNYENALLSNNFYSMIDEVSEFQDYAASMRSRLTKSCKSEISRLQRELESRIEQLKAYSAEDIATLKDQISDLESDIDKIMEFTKSRLQGIKRLHWDWSCAVVFGVPAAAIGGVLVGFMTGWKENPAPVQLYFIVCIIFAILPITIAYLHDKGADVKSDRIIAERDSQVQHNRWSIKQKEKEIEDTRSGSSIRIKRESKALEEDYVKRIDKLEALIEMQELLSH